MRHPETFGRYQVVDQIGRGGMATVYLAWDPTLERKVAIKVLIEDNPELRERFSREARSAARLRHPHIVTMYDVGEYGGQPFMAMEFVEGQNLAELIRNRPPLPLGRRLEIASQLAEGLAYAHARGVVHRDVKPANVMLDGTGSVKILDFGIARLTESAGMTQTGVPIGTYNYMSPEQLGGKPVDQRSDIFSFGALFFELLAFRQAFPGSIDTGLLHRVLTGQREPIQNIATLPADVVRVVDRLLAPDVEQRYQSMDAVLEDLRRVQEQLGPSNVDVTVVSLPFPSEASLRPPVTPRASTPRRAVDLGELARRRAKQIQESLQAAREALAVGDLDGGIAACEGVLLLDPHEPTAIALLDQARSAADERQAEELLQQAERELQRGALAAALSTIDRAEHLVPASPRVAQLRRTAEEAQRERERLRARQEAIRQALSRSHAHFDKGRFAEAAQAADEALALDASLAEARGLKERAAEAIEMEAREAAARLARAAVRDARRRFTDGDHAGAIAALEQFAPAHDLVSRALEQLRTDAARIAEQQRLEAERLAEQRRLEAERQAEERRREAARLAEEQRLEAERQAAQRQREEEARARWQRVSAAVAQARADIDHQDFIAAIERLEALEQAEGQTPEVTALLAQAIEGHDEQERLRRRDEEVAEHVARAAGLFARKDLAGALARIESALALDATHAAALAWRTKVSDAMALDQQRRDAEDRRAREQAAALRDALDMAAAAATHEDAITVLEQALTIDPEHAPLHEQLAFHRDALQREEAERQRLARRNALRRGEIRIVAEEGRRALDVEDVFSARAALGRLQVLDPQDPATLELARELASLEAGTRHPQADDEDPHRPEPTWAETTWTQPPVPLPPTAATIQPLTPAAPATVEETVVVPIVAKSPAVKPPAAPPAKPASSPAASAPGATPAASKAKPAATAGATPAGLLKSPYARPAAVVGLGILLGTILYVSRGGSAAPPVIVPPTVATNEATPASAGNASASATSGNAAPAGDSAAASVGTASSTTTTGGVTPAAAPPAADNTPPAAASAPVTAAMTPAAQVAALVQTARTQYGSGARVQALDTMSAGLKQQPDNRDLRDLLSRVLQDARTEYGSARTAALAAGAERAQVADAERQAQSATRLAGRGANADAIRAYWGATAAMTMAGNAANRTARNTSVPTPSPTNSPAAANVDRPATASPAIVTPPPAAAPAAAAAPAQVQPPVVTPPPAAPPETAPAPPSPTVARAPEPQPAVTRPPANAVSNEQAIRAVVTNYASAYSRLDAAGVAAVFPGVDAAALQRTFSRMRSQQVQLEGEQIQVNGTTATVTGTWRVVFELAAGGPQRSAPRVTLTLRRNGDSWQIVERR